MKIYKEVTTLESFDEREQYVFTTFIKQINYWNTDELDLMCFADNGGRYLTRFNTIKANLISNDLVKLKNDTIILDILEFWNKYSKELHQVWHGDLKVIL